ncbi:hypothetical protein K1719_002293 [Acacia pycnantha]|nr:hypothetical protein K1719_002293 [Acacia pycnantha]
MAILLGPPEIYNSTAVAVAVTSGDPFMDQMVANFNKIPSLRRQNMGLTENNSPTFLSTGDPCLDFFFHIVPDTPPSSRHTTLAFNVPSFAEFGYFKDLPEILYRILEGLDVRKLRKEEWPQRKGSRKYNKISQAYRQENIAYKSKDSNKEPRKR